MIKIEKLSMPAADIGPLNPMPDIKNVTYIHADYEVKPTVTESEKTYMGKGMIETILPYQLQDNYNREKKMRDFTAVVLENSKLRAVFLPEIGGRLWSLFDKELNRELLYVNPVYQPGNLAIRNGWISGGVEFNVGIKGHTPLTSDPMWCRIDKTEDGEVLHLYEYERIRGVVYSISAWLPEDSNTLYIHPKIENKTGETKPMYWWSNISVDETVNTRVLVPAEDSFLTFYNADHYVVDKASIPTHEGVDVSYPANIATSRDFFYKIPPKEKKWIAAVEKDGLGLLHCSTQKLIGRKLFLWGQNAGGKNWDDWLSVDGMPKIEIQAGLVHTQLEHIPMEGNTTWEWTEAYTALQGDPAVMHGDYAKAIATVDAYMVDRVGNPDELQFPNGKVLSSEIVFKGSDWGYLEEQIRGTNISDCFQFPALDAEDTAPWKELLGGNFPVPAVTDVPKSYVVDETLLGKLMGLAEQSWFSLLHIGVILYAKGDLAGAQKAWEDSLAKTPSPWAYRNIAMLYKNEFGDIATAKELILKAFAMLKDNPTLCKEVAQVLLAADSNQQWLDIYDSLSADLQSLGRLRMYKAIALIELDRLEEAAEIINDKFFMSDIKEGELSVSRYWFRLYRSLYAKEMGIAYEPQNKAFTEAADKKYPLPKKQDFRMQ